jgi:TolB-like protein
LASYENLAEPALALVRRLEETGALGAGGRLPALLRYLVQEELAGRGDRLKAYAIATQVLGRGQSFDPAQDSIVRVEIGRLRKALDLYFATQGRDEPVRIAIPRGANRPRILAGDPVPDPAASPPQAVAKRRLWPVALALLAAVAAAGAVRIGWERRAPTPAVAPRLILLPVQTEGADPQVRALALGLRSQLAAELSQQTWLTVLLGDEPSADAAAFAAAPVLIKDADGYTLSAQLLGEPDRRVRWSGRYRNAQLHEPLIDLAADLAGQLARDLGYPLGPIGQAFAARSGVTDADVEDRFLCMMNVYRYWRDLDPKQGDDARSCLTRLTARAADFAEGRAALALFAIEEGRDLDGDARAAAFAKAASLLRAGPDDDRLTLMARLSLAACEGRVEDTKSLARALEADAPNDPDSLAEAANQAGLAALDWPFALRAEARAFKLTRDYRPGYAQASAAKALMERDYEGALRAISRAPQQGQALGQTMLLVIAQLAQAPLRAEGAAAALAKLQVVDAAALKTTIARACWHPDVKAAFLDALALSAAKP